MKPAIRIANLSKRYRLGELHQHWTIGDQIAAFFKRPSHNGLGAPDEIWALKDVSFDVVPGEVVGIIGHNGAGKSTLLKVLSRVTEPTTGEIELHGRVLSLLEVGTGFHPDLTGRDNVYLNGSILGMKKVEIDRKFDEIVDFSGLEKFLETPVKRYSSGMQVRLAFAVAAHLEPEILIVDEVLAVGDAEFQRKCIGKMSDVASSGKTVLFVSHNMAAVENLCTYSILLSGGRVEAIGSVKEIIGQYMSAGSLHVNGTVNLAALKQPPCAEADVLKVLRILDAHGQPTGQVRLGSDFTFEVLGFAPSQLDGVWLNIRIDSSCGQRVAACPSKYQYADRLRLEGAFSLRCVIRNIRLMPDIYHVTLILHSVMGVVEKLGPFAIEIIGADVFGTGRSLPRQTGIYVPEAVWQIECGASVTSEQ